MSDWIRGVLVLGMLALVAWVAVSATAYNGDMMALCEKHGMVMAQEFFFGEYGCAKVIPFDEVGK